MKRILVITGVILGLICSFAMKDSASAKSIQGRTAVGLFYMPVATVGSSEVGISPLASGSVSGSALLDPSTGFGLTVTRGWGSRGAIELSLDRSMHDVTHSSFDYPLAEVTMTTLGVSLEYRGGATSSSLSHYYSRFSPFIGIGAGYSLNSSDITSEVQSGCKLVSATCTFDVDNSMTLHLNGGTDFFFTDNWALSIEGRIITGSASTIVSRKTTTSTLSSEGDLNLSRIDLMAGVKYYF